MGSSRGRRYNAGGMKVGCPVSDSVPPDGDIEGWLLLEPCAEMSSTFGAQGSALMPGVSWSGPAGAGGSPDPATAVGFSLGFDGEPSDPRSSDPRSSNPR